MDFAKEFIVRAIHVRFRVSEGDYFIQQSEQFTFTAAQTLEVLSLARRKELSSSHEMNGSDRNQQPALAQLTGGDVTGFGKKMLQLPCLTHQRCDPFG